MSVLHSAWTALGEDPRWLSSVISHGRDVPLAAELPVGELVHDAIAIASLSRALSRTPAPTAPPRVELGPARIATAVTSERWFRQAGEAWMPWAAHSGFFRAADGWLRTHGNYPHHRDRLLAALHLAPGASAEDLAAAISTRAAAEIERDVVAAGGVASIVRTADEWRAHPHAAFVDGQPIVALSDVGPGPTRAVTAPRILDLTRVIAGPTATRTLALGGADVLRVDPPGLAEPAEQHLDTGAGKRSVVLAIDDPRFEALLAEADVLVTGYRSGAVEARGLDSESLALRHPGLVVARLSAWGDRGPLAGRRGFDSIVQAATGIAVIEGDNDRPGALPAQALDHAAGYLLAAGVEAALRRRAATGGSWRVGVSLARVAHELLALPRPGRRAVPGFEPTTVRHGDLVIAAPALAGETDWPSPPVPFGSSDPTWLPRPVAATE